MPENDVSKKVTGHEVEIVSPAIGDAAVVTASPWTTMENILTVAVNTGFTRRTRRPPAMAFVEAVAGRGEAEKLNRWNLHFISDVVEIARVGEDVVDSDVNPDLSSVDGAQPGLSEAGKAALAATTYEYELGQAMHLLAPGLMKAVQTVDVGDAQDSASKIMREFHKLSLRVGVNLLTSASVEWTDAELLHDAGAKLDALNGVKSPFCFSAAAGQFFVRPALIAHRAGPNHLGDVLEKAYPEDKAPEDILSPSASSGVVSEAASQIVGAWLSALDTSGWDEKMLHVDNADPRLRGLHPRDNAVSFIKQAIVAERMNNLILIYRHQLMVFWILFFEPFIQGMIADAAEMKIGGVVATAERILAAARVFPLHPMLSAILKAYGSATLRSSCYSGQARVIPWAIGTSDWPYVNGPAASSMRNIDNKWWARIPWIKALARNVTHPGWRLFTDASDAQADAGIRALGKLADWAEDVLQHHGRAPRNWEEVSGMLGWSTRTHVLPPVAIKFDATDVAFFDGHAVSKDPLSLLHGWTAVLPVGARKLQVTTPTRVRLGTHEWNIMTAPYSAGAPTALVGLEAPTYMPKWAYLGEDARKVFLEDVLRKFINLGSAGAAARFAVLPAVGPSDNGTPIRYEGKRPSREDFTVSRIWPSQPGVAVYSKLTKATKDAEKVDLGCGRSVNDLAAVAYAGRSWMPPLHGADMDIALRTGSQLPELPKDYENGAGLLKAAGDTVFYDPRTITVALVEGLKSVDVSGSDLAALSSSLGSIEVRVMNDPSRSFFPRFALLMQAHSAYSGNNTSNKLGAIASDDGKLLKPGPSDLAEDVAGMMTSDLDKGVGPRYALFDSKGYYLQVRRTFRPELNLDANSKLATGTPVDSLTSICSTFISDSRPID